MHIQFSGGVHGQLCYTCNTCVVVRCITCVEIEVYYMYAGYMCNARSTHVIHVYNIHLHYKCIYTHVIHYMIYTCNTLYDIHMCYMCETCVLQVFTHVLQVHITCVIHLKDHTCSTNVSHM